MKLAVLTLLAVVLAGPAFGAVDPDSVFGVWLTERGDSKLEIFPCGDKACAKVVWLKNPTYLDNAKGSLVRDKVDLNNPDPVLRNRPILGLQVMAGFMREGDEWGHGSCYDPQSGKNYRCQMRLTSATELKLRGFIGISLIGRSYTLTRAQESVSTASHRGEAKSSFQ